MDSPDPEKEYLRQQIKALTEHFEKNGGVIERCGKRGTDTIKFKEIVKRFNITEDDLARRIYSFQFVPSVTGNSSGNTRIANMSFFLDNVITYFNAQKRKE